MLLKKVFEKIFSWKQSKETTKIEKVCSIEFFINTKQEYHFLCNWAEIDGVDTAKFLAQLLFAINSGYYNEQIVKTLLDNVRTEQDKIFVDDVLFTWGITTKEWEKIVEKDKNDRPIIKPSQAFDINAK